jgi:glutaredoxin-dependent peroxiredoxin
LCGVRDTLADFDALNCKVFGISTDSPFALDAWAREQGYQFPLLSDYNRDVSRAYGSLYEELLGFKGVSKRSAFVIDREGKVRFAYVSDQGNVPDFDAIKTCLKQLQ